MNFLVGLVQEELLPMEKHLLSSLQGKGAVEVVPCELCSPSWFLLLVPAPGEAGGVCAAPLAGVPVEVSRGQAFPCPTVSRLLPVLRARRSPASHELCTGKSFIFLSLPRHVLSLNFYVCNPS